MAADQQAAMPAPAEAKPKPAKHGLKPKPSQAPELGRWSAFWNAFWAQDTSYFPRIVEDGVERTLDADGIIKTVNVELGKLNIDALDYEGLETLRARYRESLDEVKEQTEYQDQKAARLLTIISVFVAVGGVIIGKFVDYYPFLKQDTLVEKALVVVAYGLFAAFLATALSGAVVIFHASRTRFLYSKDKARAKPKVLSRLFYLPISKTQPQAWANQVGTYLADPPTQKSADLSKFVRARVTADYLRDVVLEAYLIACKANDKVRYMRPAQDLLSLSTKLFLIWIVFSSAALATVSRWKEPSPPPQPPATTSIQVTSQSSATVSPISPAMQAGSKGSQGAVSQ